MPKKTKLKNSNKMDMINGPIWNKLPRFALPVAATAILEQLFNASDLAVVGNFTGAAKTASVAAVGANSPVIGLILNLFIGNSPRYKCNNSKRNRQGRQRNRTACGSHLGAHRNNRRFSCNDTL